MWPEWQISGQSWTDWGLSGVLKKGPAAPQGRDSPQVCRGVGGQSRVPSKVRVSVLGHVSTLRASEPAALPLGVPSVVDGADPLCGPPPGVVSTAPLRRSLEAEGAPAPGSLWFRFPWGPSLSLSGSTCHGFRNHNFRGYRLCLLVKVSVSTGVVTDRSGEVLSTHSCWMNSPSRNTMRKVCGPQPWMGRAPKRGSRSCLLGKVPLP